MSDDTNGQNGTGNTENTSARADTGSDQVDSLTAGQTQVPAEDGQDSSEQQTATAVPVIAAPPTDPVGDARRASIHALVEEWWNDHMPGSVVGRSTEIWNYVHGAKEALKTKLDAWTDPKNPPATPPAVDLVP